MKRTYIKISHCLYVNLSTSVNFFILKDFAIFCSSLFREVEQNCVSNMKKLHFLSYYDLIKYQHKINSNVIQCKTDDEKRKSNFYNLYLCVK